MFNREAIYAAMILGLVTDYFNLSDPGWQSNASDRKNFDNYYNDTFRKLRPCLNGNVPCCDASFSDAQCDWAINLAGMFRKLA